MSKNTMQIRRGVGHRNKLADLLWCSLYLQQSQEGVVMVIINRSSCLDNLWCNTWRIHLNYWFLSRLTPHQTLCPPEKKSFWALTCKSYTNYVLQNIPYLLVKKIQQIENIRIYTFILYIMNRKEKLCKIDKYTVKRKLSQYESTVSSIEIVASHNSYATTDTCD